MSQDRPPAVPVPDQSTDSCSTLDPPEKLSPHRPPPIAFNPWHKKTSIIVCTCILLVLDLIIPCLLYYVLAFITNLDDADVLGISCLSLGLGELAELPLRGYRLWKYHDEYAPLGQTSKWAFDTLFWFYTAATIVAAVPYVFATDLDDVIYWLFIFTPGIFVGFCATPLIITIVRFPLPMRVSSDPAGTLCKPYLYYIIEDFVAVDAGQGRTFREQWKCRYDESPIMRRAIWQLNLFWAAGCFIFMGALAGITWGTSIYVSFGVSFGMIFIWLGVWAVASWLWVKHTLAKELEWFQRSDDPVHRT